MLTICLMLIVVLPGVSCSQQTEQSQTQDLPPSDSANTALLMQHLRTHFDDLHDVSMRFHHMDHTLGGMIVFETSWENGNSTSIQVVENETGDSSLAASLIEKFSAWQIEGMEGTFATHLPIRIQLVGSDDPDFPNRALITGLVADADGEPLHRARLKFVPQQSGQESVPNATTNREGIFVRTLIPPGEWALECTYEGKTPVVVEGIMLDAGEHHRETIVMN